MPRPQHVPHTSADLSVGRLSALRDLIPEAFAEGKIDFAKLREALGVFVDESPERYSFTWAGKRDAIRQLQAPTNATLIPAPEESVNWETTQNLFIEGDNLEVLKLLYKAYFGRVKLIYIDPPYNTGNDFIYPDDYKDPLRPYLQLTGQMDQDGNLITSNTEASGRYHSAWLSMMYPRLFVARQLLREDGVIFISIDDGEVHNLRLILNELFGEENFVANVIWQKKQSPQNDATYFSDMHDHLLVYAKRAKSTKTDPEGWVRNMLPRSREQEARYANPDNDDRGVWASMDLTCNKTADERPNLFYPIAHPDTGQEIRPSKQRVWLFERERMEELLKDGRVYFGPDGQNFPRQKRFLSEVRQGIVPSTLWLRDQVGDNQEAAREIRDLFPETYGVFDTPKPVRLIQRQLELTTTGIETELVLDFFAGSCSTAQAVLERNCADGGQRQFIMVQLPVPTGRPDYPSVADVGKERIRRSIDRLQAAGSGSVHATDADGTRGLGFRVFKLAQSHFRDWAGTAAPDPDEYVMQIADFGDPLFAGADPQAVIWEVAIKEGYPLTSRVEPLSVQEHTVYRVTDSDTLRSFHICLDAPLSDDVVTALDLATQDLFVCRDLALDDSTAANLALQCRLRVI